jgi:dipeptidyl aminopeptidase/acylaminoacyl peptidase
VVVHRLGRTNRIEFPLGTIIYETPRQIFTARISPDGKRIGFVEADRGEFNIAMIEGGEMELVARGWAHGVSGLSWSPDGKKLLFAGSESGNTPLALYSVAPGGTANLIARMTGSLRLHDVARNGRILLVHNSWRSSLMRESIPKPEPQVIATTTIPGTAVAALAPPPAVAPPVEPPRDLAWLDWSIAADVSRDGKTVLFSETREGGGEASSIFLRGADGSNPVRLGEGFADALSPDGKWVLAHRERTKLVLLPTGTGEAREVKGLASVDQGALFFPDGRHVLVGGAMPQHDFALHIIDVEEGTAKQLTPEGIGYPAYRPFAISPDGTLVAGMTKEKVVALYPVDGSAPRPVAGARPDEIPVQFTPDGASLLVYRPLDVPAKVIRIDLANGSREPWHEFTTSDSAGVYRISPVLVSADGTTAVYNVLRSLADLYVAEGLQ